MKNIKTLVNFWIHYPALFYALGILLGLYASIRSSWTPIFPLFALWIPFAVFGLRNNKKYLFHLILNVSLFLGTYSFGSIYFNHPFIPSKGIEGAAHLSIQSIKLKQTPFGQRWVYDCHLVHFYNIDLSNPPIASHLRCYFEVEDHEKINRPTANSDYLIAGTLSPTEKGSYKLKINKGEKIHQIESWRNISERRYAWKQTVIEWISDRFKDPLIGVFLSGLVTGEFFDPLVGQEFSRFGLQHLMAISGFHFTLFAGFFSFILQAILPRTWKPVGILLFLSAYALFLGAQPSVMRTFVMCSVALLGEMLHKKGVALNSIGVAMIVVVCIDPLNIELLSFKLSFLAASGILLGYSLIDNQLEKIFQTRAAEDFFQMNFINRLSYTLLILFRQGLALSVAVNLFTLPIILCYIQKFSVLSLFYNLFYPFLITVCMVLLMCGILCSWIPFLGNFLFFSNEKYTSWVLSLAHQMPDKVDLYVFSDRLNGDLLIIYLTALLIVIILLRDHVRHDEEPHFLYL